jgi:lipase
MRLHVHEWGDAGAPPVVCVHGVSAHGRRFRKLAEERLASSFHVLAPDLRGHGLSEHDPPWDIATHVRDVEETLEELGVEAPAWVGHSFGGRLVPHVGYDFAQEAAQDHAFASVDEAIEARLTSGSFTPREFLEEEAHEHLAPSPDGRLRWQCSRAAVATMYSELCREPPSSSVLAEIPALLVHASQFGLVRDEQLEEYERALGDGLEVVAVPGGHIVYWDAYEQTADAVEKFLIRHRNVSHT